MNVREALKPRATYMAYIFSQLLGESFEGGVYANLESEWVENGIRYWIPYSENHKRAGDDGHVKFASIVFTDIIFQNAENLELSEPETLSSENQDAVDLKIDNTHGTSPITEHYTTEFSKTDSESDRYLAALESSVRTWFGTGEEEPISTGVELTVTARAEFEKTRGTERSESRTLDVEVQALPGEKKRWWGTRNVAKKRRIARGSGALEHKIWMGSFQQWYGIPGHAAQSWHFQNEWESFTDFMSVIKGEKYGPMADIVRNRPAPTYEVEVLSAPLGKDIEIIYEYDSCTDAELAVADY